MDHTMSNITVNISRVITWRDVFEKSDPSMIEYIPDHWLNYEPPSRGQHLFLAALYSFLLLTGVLANGTIIFLYTRCKTLQVPSNVLVLNLAISDLIMIGKAPVFIYNSLHSGPALGSFGCQVYGFLSGLSGTSAIMTIAAMAGERYHVINNPFGRKLTIPQALMIVSLIWIYSFIFAVLPLLGVFTSFVPEGYLTSCSFDYLSDTAESKTFIFIYFIAAFCVPLCIIVYSYVGIFMAVRKSNAKFRSTPTTSPAADNTKKESGNFSFRLSRMKECSSKDVESNSHRRQRREIKLAKIALVLISLWVISWTPYAVVALIGIFSPDKSILTPTFTMVPALFAKMSAVVDPFVYGHSHQPFKTELKRMLFGSARVPGMPKRLLEIEDRGSRGEHISPTPSSDRKLSFSSEHQNDSQKVQDTKF